MQKRTSTREINKSVGIKIESRKFLARAVKSEVKHQPSIPHGGAHASPRKRKGSVAHARISAVNDVDVLVVKKRRTCKDGPEKGSKSCTLSALKDKMYFPMPSGDDVSRLLEVGEPFCLPLHLLNLQEREENLKVLP